jgi:hypothetical protein
MTRRVQTQASLNELESNDSGGSEKTSVAVRRLRQGETLIIGRSLCKRRHVRDGQAEYG